MIYGLSQSDLFMNGFGTDTYAGLYIYLHARDIAIHDPFTPPLKPVCAAVPNPPMPSACLLVYTYLKACHVLGLTLKALLVLLVHGRGP